MERLRKMTVKVHKMQNGKRKQPVLKNEAGSRISLNILKQNEIH